MRRSSLESRREEASPRLRNVDWPRYPVGIHGKHKSEGSRRFGHIVGLVDLEVWIPPVERGRQQVIERFRPRLQGDASNRRWTTVWYSIAFDRREADQKIVAI